MIRAVRAWRKGKSVLDGRINGWLWAGDPAYLPSAGVRAASSGLSLLRCSPALVAAMPLIAAATLSAGDVAQPPNRYSSIKTVIESMEVLCAATDAEINACFGVLRILRPHLDRASFIPLVRRQESQGYKLAFIRDEGCVVSVAGYRILEFLAWGRVLYVDDLVTDPERRGSGFGGAMMDWLISSAHAAECAELHLDTGYQRHAAHRLYLEKGLELNCHHLALKLDSSPSTPATREEGAAIANATTEDEDNARAERLANRIAM